MKRTTPSRWIARIRIYSLCLLLGVIAAIELQVAGALASRFGQITASQAGSVQAPSLGISDLVAAAR
jgi:hypothetical protein